MRPMSATLQAAAKSPDREPYVLARISDQPCERPRLELVECYTGTEGDQPNAAAVALDGSVLRIRTPASGGTVYGQRVTDVTSASQWAAWTAAPGYSAGSPPRVDVWVDGATGRCWRAIVGGAGGTGVYAAYSDDHGATWTSWGEVMGGSTPVVGIGGWADNGVVRLCVALNPGASTNYLAMFGWAAGIWSVLGETAHNRGLVDGIGTSENADGNLYILIAEGSPSRLAFQEFLLGTSQWGAAGVVLETGAGSVVSFAEPRYSRLDEPSRAVLAYVERSSSPAYQRAVICFSPVRWFVTEEVPWRFGTTHGVEVLRTSSRWLIVGSNRAYRAARYTGASGELLGVGNERIVALESRLKAGQPGWLRLLVDNSGGWYDQAGVSGVAKCIRPGAQLGLMLGLRTTAGQEGVWQTPWWITRVGFETRQGEGPAPGVSGYLVIEARDTWGELRALRARRQYQWSGVTLGGIVQRCWWRVCGRAEAVPHGNMALVVPYFAVGAGERWGDAVARLCRMTGTVLRWYNASADGIGWGAVFPEVVDLGVGSSAWTFGGSGQEIVQESLWRGLPSAQHVEVFGSGYWGEHRDWDGVWEQWRDVGERVVDFKLDAQGEVGDRAAWEWRYAGVEGEGGLLRVWLVPGLEIGDAVTVNEPRAGLDGALRTVVGIRTVLERRRHVYEQEIELRGTV